MIDFLRFCGMDETRTHALRGFHFYNPSKPPLDRGGLVGREFKPTYLQQKSNGSQLTSVAFCGMDETRTRDLLRDRQAF